MRHLISVEELRQRLGDPELRVVDTRFDLSDTSAGRRAYLAGHLPGALYAHLDHDLSGARGRHGGRHPLPAVDDFVAWLEGAGIGNRSHVVVYDADSGMFASRLWWMLRYLGHDEVAVLDGGFAAWSEIGGPVETTEPHHPRARFVAQERHEMIADREYVLRNLGNPDVILVDARAPERYRGEVEPIDPKAGHIPSAINLPYAGNLSGGRFLPPEALAERFSELGEAEEVIVYCGSGVSAAHDVLAMEEAGLPAPRLYVGSWSDWSSFDDAAISVAEEP